jgi:integrase
MEKTTSDTRGQRDGIRKCTGKKSVTWQAVARIPGIRPAYKTFKSRTDARRWKKLTEAAMLERRYFASSEADRRTLGEMVQRYIKANEDNGDRRTHLKWWQSKLGSRILSDITVPDIAEMRDELLQERNVTGRSRKPATVNRHLTSLSVVYELAKDEWGWVDDNPVRKVKKLKEPSGRVRYLSDDELNALLEVCKSSDSPNLHPLVLLALSCGARAGELLDLRWQDIDFDRGMAMLLKTKNGERRAISVKGKALEVLRQHRKVRRLDTDRVFPSPDGIKRYHYRKHWDACLEEAGITDFRFHDLRHTCASYLAMNGASIPEIAAVLGHKSWAVTQRYSHLSDAHISEVVEQMNEKLLGQI